MRQGGHEESPPSVADTLDNASESEGEQLVWLVRSCLALDPTARPLDGALARVTMGLGGGIPQAAPSSARAGPPAYQHTAAATENVHAEVTLTPDETMIRSTHRPACMQRRDAYVFPVSDEEQTDAPSAIHAATASSELGASAPTSLS